MRQLDRVIKFGSWPSAFITLEGNSGDWLPSNGRWPLSVVAFPVSVDATRMLSCWLKHCVDGLWCVMTTEHAGVSCFGRCNLDVELLTETLCGWTVWCAMTTEHAGVSCFGGCNADVELLTETLSARFVPLEGNSGAELCDVWWRLSVVHFRLQSGWWVVDWQAVCASSSAWRQLGGRTVWCAMTTQHAGVSCFGGCNPHVEPEKSRWSIQLSDCNCFCNGGYCIHNWDDRVQNVVRLLQVQPIAPQNIFQSISNSSFGLWSNKHPCLQLDHLLSIP
jgi:hypothetical protein